MRIRDDVIQTGDVPPEKFQQIGGLGGIHVICVGVLTTVLTRVSPTALLMAKFIGNTVEWRMGGDSNPRFSTAPPLNSQIYL